MKFLLSVLLVISGFNLCLAQTGNANVKKVNGFDIYIYAEPTKEYDEVFELSGAWNWTAIGGGQVSIDNIVETMIRNAKKKNERSDMDKKKKNSSYRINR